MKVPIDGVKGFSKAQGYLYIKNQSTFEKVFCELRETELYYDKKLLGSLKDYDVYSLNSDFSFGIFAPFSLGFGFALKRQNVQDADVLFFGVEKEKSCLNWIQALRLNRSIIMRGDDDADKNHDNEKSTSEDEDDEPLFEQWQRYSGSTASPSGRKFSIQSNDSLAGPVLPSGRKGSIQSNGSYLSPIGGSNQSDNSLLSPTGPSGSIQSDNSYSAPASPLERKNSIQSNSSFDLDDHRKGKIKPLVSFQNGEHGSSQNTPTRRRKYLKEDKVSKKKDKGKKLLVDVSDVNLCQTCGCSEFRAIFAGKRENVCGNCLHVHNV
jgi:hypothetical protein